MYKTSTAFNQAIKNGERIYVKVKCGNFVFGYNDETDPASPKEQNNIMELNIDRSISHDDYALAKSYACGCNCVLWAVPAGAVLRGQKTVVYFGCMVNGAVEWVPMGVFYPEKVTRSGECTTLEMYDHMYDLSMPYSAAISGQQTPLAILKDLARQGNFELAAGVESKVSGFGTVDVSLLCGTETDEDGKQQVTAYNVNDAIGYVAGFCGCAAVFDRGDKIIGVKFGLAAGFLPFSTATVLQRRYCCKNCSIACLIICACAMPSAAHFSRKAAAISLGTRTEIVSYTFWLYLAFTWVDVLVFLFASLMTQPPYFTDHIAQDYKRTAANGHPQRNTHSGTDRHHQKHAQNGHPKTILFHLKNSFLYDIINMPIPARGRGFRPSLVPTTI